MIYSQWTSVPTLRAREDQIPLLSMMFLSPRHYLRCTCHSGEKPVWQAGGWTHVHLSPPRTHESDLFGKLVFCRQNDDNDLDIRLPCTGKCISPCLQSQPLGGEESRPNPGQSELHRKFKARLGDIAQTCLKIKSSSSIGDT